ncbi:heparin lyase I family protein [Sphingomonas morindae]|uniref:Heparin lyase I family protein n=1 Tax=Sphingomonas morindae TaxID=1541170 RepID=A0ABY4X6F0_9SPHN|nr:heparin lyase I family protein [Sphingomonas morindae]USI72456.1 heparin lyase I family protein [Sphingomonas morindae]
MATKPVYTVSQWNANLTGYYSIDMAGYLFSYQGAAQSYAMSAPDANTVRFELHQGDNNWWDASVGHNVGRVELATRDNVALNGTPLHVSYGFTLEKGPPNTASWVVLGQLHQDLDSVGPGPPPFAIGLNGEKMTVIVRYTGADGKQVEKTIFSDPYDIDRGHQYQFDIKAITDPSGKVGRIVVTRDGVTIADYSGQIGDPSMKGVYWAEGIYRDGNATETIAADYSNLKISTGSDVSIPSASDFIAAPTLAVSTVVEQLPQTNAVNALLAQAKLVTSAAPAAAAAGSYSVTLTGTAKANAVVNVYEGKTLIGTAKADAQGHVSLTVQTSGAGTHNIYSTAVDDSGRAGVTSQAMHVVIGTAASIASQFDTLSKDTGLGAVVITDTPVINVSNSVDLSRYLHATDFLAKIQGTVLLKLTETVAGSGYDQQVRTYDASGTLLEMQRFSAGRLTMDQTYSGTETVTHNYAADGTSSIIHNVAGKTVTADNFGANGIETSRQVYFTDGGKQYVYFDATGTVNKTITYPAAGGRIENSYGLTGKTYVSQTIVYDAAGKLLSQGRFDAAGHLVWASDATGANTTYTYDASGTLNNYRMNKADGSYSITTFGADGSTVLSTKYYTNKNVLTGTDTGNPAPAAAAPVLAALAKEAAIEASTQPVAMTPALDSLAPTLAAAVTSQDNGVATVTFTGTGHIGATVTIMDGNTVVGTTVVDGTGKLAEIIQISGAGQHNFTAVMADAAGHTGVSNAASVVVKAAAPVISQPDSVAVKAPAVHVFATMADLQMSLKTDAVSGDASALLKLDQTITNQSYDHQVQTFDHLGNRLQIERYSGATKTMDELDHGNIQVTHNTKADGSYTVTRTIDGTLVGSTSYDANGQVTETTIKYQDGSTRDVFSTSTGAVTSSTFYASDGTRAETTLGITGRDYAQQTLERSANGTLIYGMRADAAGHVLTAMDYVHGLTASYQYDASGTATGYRLTNADGSYSVTRFGSDGHSVVSTSSYTAKGALTGTSQADPGADLLAHVTAVAASTHSEIGNSFTGTTGDDKLVAGSAASLLDGGLGNDTLIGGAGNDLLMGGRGSDVMTGGGGNNVFWFGLGDTAADTKLADRITDFHQGDKIDVSTMANAISGHAGFTFLGTDAFNGVAGAVHVVDIDGNSFVQGDLNGDKVADFSIRLDGHHSLAATDFLF